MYKQVRMVRRV